MWSRPRGGRSVAVAALATSLSLLLLLLLALALALPAACTSDGDRGLAAVRARKALRWGADQEGGGPYIYPSPDDPSRVVGFEVDLLPPGQVFGAPQTEVTRHFLDEVRD